MAIIHGIICMQGSGHQEKCELLANKSSRFAKTDQSQALKVTQLSSLGACSKIILDTWTLKQR